LNHSPSVIELHRMLICRWQSALPFVTAVSVWA